MAIIIPANSAADTAYEVANSCRFEDGDTAHFTRTTETPTNVDKYTFSVWVKRGNLGIANTKLFSIADGTYGEEKLEFNVDDIIWRKTDPDDGCADYERYTDRKFRDSSAWYHILVAYDSSDGTAGDRMKMYINGVQETSFSGSINPDLNENSHVNTASKTLYIGKFKGTGQPFDGYMAEVAFVDGVAHAVTDFGEFDSDSPTIWKPKDISSGITWGNNGFWLDFEDSSALGNDVSGNNNDLTAVNLAAADQATDTPTNNFCTGNPIYKMGTSTIAEGNCEISGTSDWQSLISTFGVSSGKWYAECKLSSGTNAQIGIVGETKVNSITTAQHIGASAGNPNIALHGSGNLYENTPGPGSSFSGTYTTGDIIGIALDMDNNKLYFSKGGAWATGSGAWDSTTFDAAVGNKNLSTTGITYFLGSSPNSSTHQWNYGGCPTFAISSGNADADGYGNFEYAPPSGYFAICTKNLAEYG